MNCHSVVHKDTIVLQLQYLNEDISSAHQHLDNCSSSRGLPLSWPLTFTCCLPSYNPFLLILHLFFFFFFLLQLHFHLLLICNPSFIMFLFWFPFIYSLQGIVLIIFSLFITKIKLPMIHFFFFFHMDIATSVFFSL